MKKHILYYSPVPNDTTALYRSTGVLPRIKHESISLTDVSHIKEFSWATFSGCDTFIMQRPFSLEHYSLLELAKDMGVRVILDYDDDLLNVDMYNPTHNQYKITRNTLLRCLDIAEEVWVSTNSIKNSFLPYTTHIEVIPNAHNDYLFPVEEKRDFIYNRKCIYRGGASHQADVNEVSQMLIGTINTHQDWNFQFMGDRFTYLELNCGDNYHIIPALTIFQYFKYLNNENPCLGIFPLRDTVFNRGKSNICWMEMCYAGAAYSGNASLPEVPQDCIFPIKKVADILNSPDVLEKLHDNSWQYIKDNILLSKINELRINRLLM